VARAAHGRGRRQLGQTMEEYVTSSYGTRDQDVANEVGTDKGVVKISKADAERLPNVTLPIPGEADEYIVGIEVYHQLHCLVGASLPGPSLPN